MAPTPSATYGGAGGSGQAEAPVVVADHPAALVERAAGASQAPRRSGTPIRDLLGAIIKAPMRLIGPELNVLGIWPKKLLEVEEPPPRAGSTASGGAAAGVGGGYYASIGQGYTAGKNFDPAPRDDPATHLDQGWGVEQWWEKLRPRFGTLGGKRPEVIDLQTIGSTVHCRQQIDLSGNPGLKGDVDRDPALLAWRERASMALQAVARLCAPLQAPQFALGEEALGMQVPRLLG
ncbi:MAG: hypothetical protein GY772_24060, partial [bacterium]|nr:hypothetical protein [bacterium]